MLLAFFSVKTGKRVLIYNGVTDETVDYFKKVGKAELESWRDIYPDHYKAEGLGDTSYVITYEKNFAECRLKAEEIRNEK